MEEGPDLIKSNYCYGCLCKNDANCLHLYNVKNHTIKALFQMGEIPLCHLCKSRAQNAEAFVQTVQSNQILLENLESITDCTIEAVRAQSTFNNLTQVLLPNIDLIDNDESILEVPILVQPQEIKIKIECKDEDSESLGHLDGDFVTDDNDLEALQLVKLEEDDYPLKLLKKELKSENINIKCVRKLKKGKVKNKNVKEKKKEKNTRLQEFMIETIPITREQCMEERAKMAASKPYLNAQFKCKDCVKGFSTRIIYDKHMERHSEKNGDFECDICKQRFSTDDKLNCHQRYHNLRYRCGVCNHTRICWITIKDHYTAYHCNDHCKYECLQCPKVFKRMVSLRKHVAYTHKRKERIKCEYCGKSYANRDVLRSHLVRTHPKEVSAAKRPKSHICQECGKGFSAPSQLKNHSVKHSHRRDYYCVECDKSFKSDSILKHHLKTAMPHTNYLELPLQCEHCDKRFSIKRDVERHTNRVHLNIKPHQCDQCERAYINSWSLLEHKKYTHDGHKRPLKFPCTMCDKVFDRKQILKGHIRTHTGERPYQCSKCPAQFSQASILGTHMKLIHLKMTRDGRPKAGVNLK